MKPKAIDQTIVKNAESIMTKWQKHLRIQDWDIKLLAVDKEWKKTGDIKIDTDDKKAVLMLNIRNPKQENTEEVIIHELLHLKLWTLDQILESLLISVFGEDDSDPKYQFAIHQFMTCLESTVEDLTKSFLSIAGNDKRISFGRVMKQVEEEML